MAPTNSFEVMALPHLNELFRTALHCLRNREAAEDCVQETCLQAQKCFHRFEAGTNCRAWLFKILLNVVRHHRRKWFRLWPADMDVVLGTTPAPTAVPEELTDVGILAALREIPESFRKIVLLADVQEFSYREISDILGVPIGTVMSRLSRGRTLLRSKLAAEYRPPVAGQQTSARYAG